MASLLVEAASHFLVEGAVEGGVVSTEQAFDRMVKEYEFAMEQQRLKREDIRDLVELTVGRMDVYHLVGALLLEFCVHFYVENKLVEDEEVPHWIVNLFLMSNVGAVGFLLFAVWLSMHASVAAHSMGVRMLLNFFRVTTPDPEELKQIQKARTLFSQVKKRVSKAFRLDAEEASAPTSFAQGVSPDIPSDSLRRQNNSSLHGQHVSPSRSNTSLGMPSASPGTSFYEEGVRSSQRPPLPENRRVSQGSSYPRRVNFTGAAASSRRPSTGVQSANANTSFLDREMHDFGILNSRMNAFNLQEHKQEFQERQTTWLAYDAYARAVMAVGVNQMLQALSYYIVGVVSRGSPTGAVASLLAVQMLSLLLLRLDAAEVENDSGKLCCYEAAGKRNVLAVFCLCGFPPIWAGCFVWFEKLPQHRNDGEPNHYAVWVTPCFVLHFLWLLYVRRRIQPKDDMVPNFPRTVKYLNVLDKSQCDLACDGPQKILDELKAARESLRKGMANVIDKERKAGLRKGMPNEMSATLRADKFLQDRRDIVEFGIQEAQLAGRALDPVEKEMEVLDARVMLRLFDLWRQVPNIHARLQALEATEEWHGERIADTIAEFERLCHSLETMCPLSVTGGVDDSCVEAATAKLFPRLHSMSEGTIVSHVEVEDKTGQNTFDDRVVVDAKTSRYCEQPHSGTITSTLELREMYGEWARAAEEAQGQFRELAEMRSSEDRETAPVYRRRDRFRDLIRGRRQEMPMMEIPISAKPPKALPWLVVKQFTSTVCFVWLVALVHHLTRCFDFGGLRPDNNHHPGTLAASWPKPEGLFKITGLFCNQSHVLVSSQFSLYAASRLSDTMLGDLLEIGTAEKTVVSCRDDGCHALSLSESGDQWQFASITSSFGTLAERAPIPAWPLVSFCWTTCRHVGCDAAWVAGWDGARSVILANLHRESARGPWKFQRRFTVEPSRSRCIGTQSACARQSQDAYQRVRGLHLGDSGRKLLVLLDGGFIDAWDLDSGTYFKRWHFHPDHSSICHDGRNIIAGRATPTGPVLETASLPDPFAIDIVEDVEEQVASLVARSFHRFLARVAPSF